MLAPIVCLSLFALSALASAEVHRVDIPRAVRSLTESRRFKRQIDAECMASCVQDFTSAMQSLGMEMSGSGFLNSRLNEPDTFDAFCEKIDRWRSCSRACPDSQAKDILVKAFQPLDSLCGEDKAEFESHQACYRKSEPQENEACDPKCGGRDQAEVQMKKLKSLAGDVDAMVRILNKACGVTSCHINCRIPVIYAVCKDKGAALFVGKWAQMTIKQAVEPLAARNLDIQCDDIVNFDPDKFQVNEDGVMVSQSGTSLAPMTTILSLFLIVVSMVFAGLFQFV